MYNIFLEDYSGEQRAQQCDKQCQGVSHVICFLQGCPWRLTLSFFFNSNQEF